MPNLEDKNWIIHVNLDAQLPAIGAYRLLLGNLIQKLKKNPALLKEFSAVKAVDGEPVIDKQVSSSLHDLSCIKYRD